MNSYELSRAWFEFSFNNPEKINPTHSAIYFFAIEHCNRLGWKDKFGFPSQMVMEALGIKNWRTYTKHLNDLIDWGFIKLIEKSQNQYSSNIIAIVKNTISTTKSLDKALQKHSTKQSHTIVSINKQYNNKQVTMNNRKAEFNKLLAEHKEKYPEKMLDEFESYWTEHGPNDKKMRFEKQTSFSIARRLSRWKSRSNGTYDNNDESYTPT
ncbi:hypothetical protein CMI47_16825 [Candidatus Pacearchaeota archaeon]|jgi:hypothetical protein|nr:hypothetical protein [Candidatus Pacearchaeota archaeon]|tara:strand:- start:649 stop:1278 length:630 start_codon:yes stop_codon:yes gene_type:complete